MLQCDLSPTLEGPDHLSKDIAVPRPLSLFPPGWWPESVRTLEVHVRVSRRPAAPCARSQPGPTLHQDTGAGGLHLGAGLHSQMAVSGFGLQRGTPDSPCAPSAPRPSCRVLARPRLSAPPHHHHMERSLAPVPIVSLSSAKWAKVSAALSLGSGQNTTLRRNGR